MPSHLIDLTGDDDDDEEEDISLSESHSSSYASQSRTQTLLSRLNLSRTSRSSGSKSATINDLSSPSHRSDHAVPIDCDSDSGTSQPHPPRQSRRNADPNAGLSHLRRSADGLGGSHTKKKDYRQSWTASTSSRQKEPLRSASQTLHRGGEPNTTTSRGVPQGQKRKSAAAAADLIQSDSRNKKRKFNVNGSNQINSSGIQAGRAHRSSVSNSPASVARNHQSPEKPGEPTFIVIDDNSGDDDHSDYGHTKPTLGRPNGGAAVNDVSMQPNREVVAEDVSPIPKKEGRHKSTGTMIRLEPFGALSQHPALSSSVTERPPNRLNPGVEIAQTSQTAPLPPPQVVLKGLKETQYKEARSRLNHNRELVNDADSLEKPAEISYRPKVCQQPGSNLDTPRLTEGQSLAPHLFDRLLDPHNGNRKVPAMRKRTASPRQYGPKNVSLDVQKHEHGAIHPAQDPHREDAPAMTLPSGASDQTLPAPHMTSPKDGQSRMSSSIAVVIFNEGEPGAEPSDRREAVSGSPSTNGTSLRRRSTYQHTVRKTSKKPSTVNHDSVAPQYETEMYFDDFTRLGQEHADELAAQQLADEEAEQFRHINGRSTWTVLSEKDTEDIEGSATAGRSMFDLDLDLDSDKTKHNQDNVNMSVVNDQELSRTSQGLSAMAGATNPQLLETLSVPLAHIDEPHANAVDSQVRGQIESGLTTVSGAYKSKLDQTDALHSLTALETSNVVQPGGKKTTDVAGRASSSNKAQDLACAHRTADANAPQPHTQSPFLGPFKSRLSSPAEQYRPPTSTLMNIKVPEPAASAASRNLSSSYSDVRQVLMKHLRDLHNDHEYKVQNELRRARTYQKPDYRSLPTVLPCAAPNGMMGVIQQVSPFDAMEPIDFEVQSKDKDKFPKMNYIHTYSESYNRSSRTKPVYKGHFACPISTYDSNNPDIPSYTYEVPSYNHYISLSRNVLGENTRQMHVLPYFGFEGSYVPVEDKVNSDLKHEFDLDVEDWPRKVLRAQQVQVYAPYVEGFLEEIGSSMSDVLYYFLEPDKHRVNFEDCIRRDLLCKEDLNRSSPRWARVYSNLSNPTTSALRRAALACSAFHLALKQFTQYDKGLTLWHIARKSQAAHLEEDYKVEDTTNRLGFYCRICYTYDCPYHGEVRQHEFSDDDESITTDDAQDADYPPNINFKLRVALPDSNRVSPTGLATAREVQAQRLSKPKNKRGVEWWYENSLTWDHTQRGPFYPCHHPGQSCNQAECRCHRDQVHCEKACQCSQSCERRYLGCSCKRGNKKRCLQDDRCDCFRLSRECDPDLCGSCGVDLILDREIEDKEALTDTCCRNAGIQLGAPKRTILGASKVHGFGLFTGEDIKKDEFVGEYLGEIIGGLERERRGTIYAVQQSSYLFTLNRDQDVDSQHMGNKVRFINHAGQRSRFRNMYPKIMLCNMAHRIGMFALKDIPVGSELFFDYGKDYHQHLVGRDPNEPTEKVVPKMKNKALVNTFLDPEENQDGDDESVRRPPVAKKTTARKSRPAIRHIASTLQSHLTSSISTSAEASDSSRLTKEIAQVAKWPAARKTETNSLHAAVRRGRTNTAIGRIPKLDTSSPLGVDISRARCNGRRPAVASVLLHRTSSAGDTESPLKRMHRSRGTSKEDQNGFGRNLGNNSIKAINRRSRIEAVNGEDSEYEEDNDQEIADSEEEDEDSDVDDDDDDDDPNEYANGALRRSKRSIRTTLKGSTRRRASED